jgi:ABC-type multidrug transport system ATPase subunit
MQSKLSLLGSPEGTQAAFDLDDLSGRREGRPGVVEFGSLGSQIELEVEGLVKGHLRFDWMPQVSTWRLTNKGPDETVFINKAKVSPGTPKVLLYSSCLIRLCGLEFWFERTPQAPIFAGKPASRFPITEQGLIIGRGEENRAGETTPRLALDPEIRTLSSKQAEIVKEGAVYRLINHNADPKNRTKINGTQNLNQRELVFGDVIQIPGLDYYTFQFSGDSLTHVGGAGAIQARGLTRMAQDGRKILAEVNIDLRCGEFVGVLGGSGQGKSTLMKALCGVEPASKGGVWVEGTKIAGAGKMGEMGIGYVPQDDIVHKELPVRRALIYSTKLRVSLPERQLNEAIDNVLETLALTEHQHKPIRVLSGGQRKRVSIASELIMNPRFLFLDEPTSGLDPLTEWDLMGDLFDLARKRRMGILCTTHVLGRSNLFSGIVFVHGGRIIFYGKPLHAARYFLVRNNTSERTSSDSSGENATASSAARATHGSHASSGSTSNEEVSEAELMSNLPQIFREVSEDVQRRTVDVKKERAQSSPAGPAKGGESVPEQVARQLEEDYQQSEFRAPLPPVDEATPASADKRQKRPGFFTTLRVLFARQWRILRADPLNCLFLLAQALLIGFLVGWVSENLVFQMFITVVATLWFGCSNGAQQIVGELSIYRRERLAGVGLNVYLWSKLLFLSLITGVQAIILFFTVLCTHHLSHKEISTQAETYDPEVEKKNFTELFFAGDPVLMKPRPVAEAAGQGLEGKKEVKFKKWLENRPPEDVTAAANDPAARAKLRAEFEEQFKLWIKENHPDKVADAASEAVQLELIEKFLSPGDFEILDEKGNIAKEEPAPPVWNPTGMYSSDKQFAMMERLAWFFRVKQNVLDELGVKKEQPSEMVRQSTPSWKGFLFKLLFMRFAALLAAAVCGVSLGLVISASVRNETQAVMWVPLILIPQILFGGFVVTAPEMNRGVRIFSQLLPSYNVQRLMDTANLQGRTVPQMTNKTKIPAFLAQTPYDKDVVRWTDDDGNHERQFDKGSEVGKSWQNLIVKYDKVGMWEKDVTKLNDDSVEHRFDVQLAQGTKYNLTNGAWMSWQVLGLWYLGCYLLVLRGLISKQTGQ